MAAASYDGAIASEPRPTAEYPLLDAIYTRHDRLLAEWIQGRTLEVACGTHCHPSADVGVDILDGNCRAADGQTAVADARRLPFADGAFDTVVGRRFVHHVPLYQRDGLLAELRRVCSPGGRLVLLEGTPGYYRQLTKGLGFALGLLGDDEDEYGHCQPHELVALCQGSGFRVEMVRPLGSILMPLAILRVELPTAVMAAIERTQWVRWWTLLVARKSTHDDDLHTDGGDDVCPECGDPVSGLVIAGPGEVTAQPCGHPARSLLRESMDAVRPDGGEER